MFTGIITDIGTIVAVDDSRGDKRFTIQTSFDMERVPLGASIACSGCCLTVVEKDADKFVVDVSAESLSKTILGEWQVGTHINLEQSLKLGDDLGGHMVSGHVDGVARLESLTPDGDSHRLVFSVPKEFSKLIAPKGSIALDGISLTVNEVEGNHFGVNIIPHTWNVTTMGGKRPGDVFNFEIDTIARYVARILAA
ncbi:MAG: riboflavin synthase [Rhodospirillales bacterium]|nr:riboflavin synthase [Rhodospirillales bacterium]MCB9972995.1 riboflavin synthase [Rhodospirillales bacterium]MCB9980017.1 riboflavin synthase [Rhodospirillales bacterium]